MNTESIWRLIMRERHSNSPEVVVFFMHYNADVIYHMRASFPGYWAELDRVEIPGGAKVLWGMRVEGTESDSE